MRDSLSAVLHEAFFRGRQALWNAADKRRYRGARALPEAAPESGRSKQGSFFFQPEALAVLRQEYPPAWRGPLRAAADRVCERRFDLLGYKDLSFGSAGVDWHLDPVHRKSSPRSWWKDIAYLDANVVGDAKIVCELNRHQFLVVLAKAHLVTGDEKYKREFIALLESWFKANPPKFGVNWSSSLELSYRLISWIWAYRLFDGLEGFPERFVKTFFAYVELQAEHVEHNLSFYFSPNTHLTGEALGLFYVGTAFPFLKHAKRRRDAGLKILSRCIDQHVLPDGGYVERTLWYHRYTLDIYLHFYLLAEAGGVALPDKIESKLLQSADFLLYAATPDGRFPLIGDDDGGRLMPLDGLEGDDLKGLCSTLAARFNRGDFKSMSEGYQEETFWLLGPKQKAFDELSAQSPKRASAAFKDTGYFFMRSGWSRQANYLVFDCGPQGWLNMGHSHADLLSFQINAGGRPVVVDPGTYTYSGQERDVFRGARSHSTISVDGLYPAVSAGPFQWRSAAHHELLNWAADPRRDYVRGRMDSKAGWTHTREIFFKKPDVFLIVDTLDGQGSRDLEVRFPLFGTDWRLEGDKKVTNTAGLPYSIEYLGEDSMRMRLSEFEISRCYGSKTPARMLALAGKSALPCRLEFLIRLSEQESRAELDAAFAAFQADLSQL